jgi:hypothetical protein
MAEPLNIKVIFVDGLVYMQFQAVDWNAYIRSQLYSMLSNVFEISVFTLSATICFQGTDFHN